MESRGLGRGLKVEERRQLLHKGLKAAVFGIPLLYHRLNN